MNHYYAGLRFLVTGGASGIGHAVATAALDRGAVVTVVDLDPSNAPIGATRHRADVADDASVADAVAHAAEAMGGIDIAAERAALEARQPSGRRVTAQEVAAAVLYLAGSEAGATTGTSLPVDGGMAGLRLRPRS